VNLPAQTIDISLSPRATASLDGGETTRSFAAPVHVGGTFANPTIGLDADVLTKLLVGSVLQQVLGGGNNSDPESGEEEATPEGAARDLIKGIFGGEPDDNSNNQQGPDGQQGPDEQQKTDEHESAAAEPSIEETLANTALNALFGSQDQPADENAETKPDE